MKYAVVRNLAWIPASVFDYYMEVGYPTEILFKECAFNSHKINCTKIVTPYFDGDMGKCFLIKVIIN